MTNGPKGFGDLYLKNGSTQGHNPALTALCVPNSRDSGSAFRMPRKTATNFEHAASCPYHVTFSTRCEPTALQPRHSNAFPGPFLEPLVRCWSRFVDIYRPKLTKPSKLTLRVLRKTATNFEHAASCPYHVTFSTRCEPTTLQPRHSNAFPGPFLEPLVRSWSHLWTFIAKSRQNLTSRMPRKTATNFEFAAS